MVHNQTFVFDVTYIITIYWCETQFYFCSIKTFINCIILKCMG